MISDVTIAVPGRSGCSLHVLEGREGYVVRKYSPRPEYNRRLMAQAKKQDAFARTLRSGQMRVPRIVATNEGSADELAWMEMEYVHGQSYSRTFSQASLPELYRIAESLRSYLSQSLTLSHEVDLNSEVFERKLDSLLNGIAESILPQRLRESVVAMLTNAPKSKIRIGRCHGDLTFSNMLFDQGDIHLIDFLDSFIESPVQDLVKIRQDTLFHWSLCVEKHIDGDAEARIFRILQFLDHEVCGDMLGKHEVAEWYNYLQTFNLLRILPYVKETVEVEFVVRCLERHIRSCS